MFNTITLPTEYHLTCDTSGCANEAEYQQFATPTDGLGTVRCQDHLAEGD